GLDSFVMADLPGLIEGAHEGVGLGHQFLRHVERTRAIVHVLDMTAEDPLADYATVRRELELYNTTLAEKPEVVALNKIDVPEARQKAEALREAFPGREVFLISGATGEGTRELLQRLLAMVKEATKVPVGGQAEEDGGRVPVLRPRGRERLDVVP